MRWYFIRRYNPHIFYACWFINISSDSSHKSVPCRWKCSNSVTPSTQLCQDSKGLILSFSLLLVADSLDVLNDVWQLFAVHFHFCQQHIHTYLWMFVCVNVGHLHHHPYVCSAWECLCECVCVLLHFTLYINDSYVCLRICEMLIQLILDLEGLTKGL